MSRKTLVLFGAAILVLVINVGLTTAFTVLIVSDDLGRAVTGPMVFLGIVVVEFAVLDRLVGFGANLSQMTGFSLRDLFKPAPTPGLSPASPPPLSLLMPPSPPKHFTGREQIISEITAALRAGGVAAITALAGMGGIGKTALAKKLAAELRDDFPGGVLWTELGRFPSELPVILGRWAHFCGRPIEDLSDIDAVMATVRDLLSARGRLLLILDDVWHDEPARTLLNDVCPDCVVALVTTRSAEVAGQLRCQVHQIGRLTDDEGMELLARLLNGLSSHEAEARTLVQRLGGHPLALELAAGQIETAGELPGLLERLRENPSLGQLKLGDAREDDVEATLALSYETLDDTARRRFRALGVFAEEAWFDAAAAAAVWAPRPGLLQRITAALRLKQVQTILEQSDTEATLRLFVRRFLLRRADSPGLYVQHPVLRLYARALLEERAEFDASADRHADYYMALANRDRQDWQTIEAVLPQIRAAWDYVLVVGDHERTLKFVSALWFFYWRRGLCDDWMVLVERGREMAESTGNREALGSMLIHIGYIYRQRGNFVAALDYYRQALDIFRQEGERALEATTINHIGYIHYQRGEMDKAEDHFRQALGIFLQVGDYAGMAQTLNHIGNIYDSRGEFSAAREHYQKALDIHRRMGNRADEAQSLSHIGLLLLQRGETDRAMDYFQQTLDILRQLGSRTDIAALRSNIALVYRERGELAQALDQCEQALTTLREVSDSVGEATTLNNIGRMLDQLDRTNEAIPLMERSVELLRVMEHSRLEETQRALDEMRAKLDQDK